MLQEDYMNFFDEYKQKLKTPDEAVKAIKSGDWVDYSVGLGFPELLDGALAKRKDDGLWCMVAGIIEPGEQPADAIKREVKEETGVE